MAKVAVNEDSLTNIGNAIREKLGVQDYYRVSEMASAIRQIHGEPLVQQKTISQNGTYSAPVGVDGFNPVVVQTIPTFSSADNGKVVSGASLVSQTSRSIASNGTYDTTQNNEVIVDTDSDATLSSGAQMLSGVTAYARGSKYTGAIPMYNGSINSGQGSVPSYDYYEGSYTIVPSTVSQAFPTAGKIMSQNLQVESYSAISADPYSGSYVIVPSTVAQSFPMAGKLMESDLTVEAYSISVDTYDGSYIATPTFASQAFPTAGKLMSEDFVVEGYSIDYYSGSYNITPSTSAQVLDTVGKTFSANLRIYGYSVPAPPVYNGSYIIEPSVSQRILSTSGKMMQSDLTIEPFTKLSASTTTLYVSENGYYQPDSAYDGFSAVTVNVGTADLMASSIQAGACSGISTIKMIAFPSVTYIGSSAFENCSNLSYADFPECITIGNNVFASCTQLSDISFPKCEQIGSNTFRGCSNLSSVSFPNCENVDYAAFAECSNLSQVSFPSLSYLGSSAFKQCPLTSVTFPACTSTGVAPFDQCSTLTYANFPVCRTVDAYVFHECGALSGISFPEVTFISRFAFEFCSSLLSASFPKLQTIYSGAFHNCNNLSAVYLLGDIVPTVDGQYPMTANVLFYNTPIDNAEYLGHYGSIYVKASLYSEFISAVGWSFYSNRIVGLTDSQISAL